jgi:hypothetical protein
LNPSRRISEIAYDVGFQSLTQFNRMFKRVFGQSPTEFRAHLHSRPPRKSKVAVSEQLNVDGGGRRTPIAKQRRPGKITIDRSLGDSPDQPAVGMVNEIGCHPQVVVDIREANVLQWDSSLEEPRTMPAKRKSPKRARRKAAQPLSERYSRLFVVNISPLWRNENDDFSLDQPSPYKVVPSITTYGLADASVSI